MILFGISILMMLYGLTIFIIIPSKDYLNWGWKKSIPFWIMMIGVTIFLAVGIKRLCKDPKNWTDEIKGKYIIEHQCAVDDIPKTYKEYKPKDYKDFNNGLEICKNGIYLYVVFIIILYGLYQIGTKTERTLEKIDTQIEILRKNNLYKKDETIKRTIELLEDARSKLQREELLKEAHVGIKLIKRAQKSHQSEDVQRDIDELEAIYKLEQREIDVISKKYK